MRSLGPRVSPWSRSTTSCTARRPAPAKWRRQPPAAPTGAVWRRAIHADEVMLFRYSALIFVGHRIHYDRRYATEVEGYPGLVVHGPLIATLLADLLRRHSSAPLKSLRFRAIKPAVRQCPVRGMWHARTGRQGKLVGTKC